MDNKMNSGSSVGYTHHQSYGYDQPSPGQQQQVMMQPQTHVVQFNTDVVSEPWSWCTLVTSVISLCCCQIFGIIAVIMSVMSYTDHKVKEYEAYRSKKACALGFGIAAIVIGSIAIIAIIAIVATTVGAAVSSAEDLQNNIYDNFNKNYNN